MTGREKFLSRIVEPDVFFILLIVGVLGLYTEFTHPGMFAPGVIGGIAIVLALFAMHMLPVNLTGLLVDRARDGPFRSGSQISDAWCARRGRSCLHDSRRSDCWFVRR